MYTFTVHINCSVLLLYYCSLNGVSCCTFAWTCLMYAKIARWRHCNANRFTNLKANYMLVRLFCVYRMTKCVRKILLRHSKRLLRKRQQILGGNLLAAPCRLHDRQICTACSQIRNNVAAIFWRNGIFKLISFSLHHQWRCRFILQWENQYNALPVMAILTVLRRFWGHYCIKHYWHPKMWTYM